MSKNPVVHFEMPYKDAKRASDFYTKAFGWGMVQMDEKMGNYIVAQTADTDENRMVKTPGTINGGLYDVSRVEKPEDRTVHVIVSVDDIEKAKEDVIAAGGTIKNDVMDIPGIGKYVSILDTEGNAVGLLQPSRQM
ncbi:MAG TPA: VOC family protein [Patescibacteria group bacterium]|nr:VOC family protein [Patescibacteria group bacterium]